MTQYSTITPSKQDRANIGYVTSVIEYLLPNSLSRKSCLEIFTASIINTHLLTEKRWTITLLPQGENCIRLNVGMIYVCDIRYDSMVFTLYKPSQNFKSLTSYLLLPPDNPQFISVPEATWCWFRAQDISDVYPLLEESYITLLKMASKTRINPAAPKAHSPGVIEYLQTHISSSVPHRPQPKQSPPSEKPDPIVNKIQKELAQRDYDLYRND